MITQRRKMFSYKNIIRIHVPVISLVMNVQELSFSGVIQNRLSKGAFYLYESLPIALNLTTNIEVNLECD